MNHYSKEPFTRRLLPGLWPASSERVGQPLCLMSPIGRKASVERETSPSHLAHSRSPPSAHHPATSFSPQYWGYLHKNFLARLAPALQAWLPLSAARRSCSITRLARLLQPRKLGLCYSGLSILLNNLLRCIDKKLKIIQSLLTQKSGSIEPLFN